MRNFPYYPSMILYLQTDLISHEFFSDKSQNSDANF